MGTQHSICQGTLKACRPRALNGTVSQAGTVRDDPGANPPNPNGLSPKPTGSRPGGSCPCFRFLLFPHRMPPPIREDHGMERFLPAPVKSFANVKIKPPQLCGTGVVPPTPDAV